MGTRVLSLLMRPMSPPLASWMVVAIALIVAEMLVVYLLRRVASEISPGVVYLVVGVLVVSSVWGPALGVVTAMLSAAAFGVFYVPPSLDFVASDPLSRAALTLVLAVAHARPALCAAGRLSAFGASVKAAGCGNRAGGGRGDGVRR